MHILFISDGDSKYGASHSMKQLISGLLKYHENITISVVLPIRSDLTNYYNQLGCNTYRILYEPFYQGLSEQKWKNPLKFVIRGIGYLLGKMGAAYCLNKKLDMSTVDIIHSNSSREDLSATLALKYKKTLIWHIREFGDNCFSFRRNYIELMNKAASKFIVVSESAKEHWITKGLDEEKIIVIYDGINTEVNVKTKYKKKEHDKIKLLMVGAVYEAKGQYQAIQACGLLTEKEREKITLDIIGEGSKLYMRKLNKIIKRYRLEDLVHLLGYKKDIAKSIGNYDCGLMCSKSEGFGRVTVEYMMAGLPVIASDIETNTELVINNENGLLYQWNNSLDLKEKIVYLVNNMDVLENMGEKAREYAISKFSIQLNAKLVYNEYLKILR